MRIIGYAESRPVPTNDTEEGRALSRRVEAGIMANEKLKEAAEKTAGGRES